MIDPSTNPLLVSAGITTSLTCAISGYALYELLSVGPEPTDTSRVVNPQLRRQPMTANIVPNVSAPQNWTVRPGQRPDFRATDTPTPESAIAQTVILLWKQGKLPQQLEPLMQQVQAGIDEVQAKSYLEAARLQATQEDYAKALKYLKQISSAASVHPQAQLKIAEYTEKQTLQAKAWMQKANTLAQLKDFSGARIYLKQVPDTTPVYPVAQNKMTEYAQTQNVQANFWFEEASKLASQGKLSDAIAYLKRIPLGTSIYTVAQTKLAEYTQKQEIKATNPKPTTKQEIKATNPKPTTENVTVSKSPKAETPSVTPTPLDTESVSKSPKAETPLVTPTPLDTESVSKSPKAETPSVTPTPLDTESVSKSPKAETPLVTPTLIPTPTAVAESSGIPGTSTLNNNSTVIATPPRVSEAPPLATMPNPRMMPVTTTTEKPESISEAVTPANRENPIVPSSNSEVNSGTPATANRENPIVPSSNSEVNSGTPATAKDTNPQTVQTPASVSTSNSSRFQIRPETVQTPTFIPKGTLQNVPRTEKPLGNSGVTPDLRNQEKDTQLKTVTPIDSGVNSNPKKTELPLVSPETSSVKNNMKLERSQTVTPVLPQLKKAPADSDSVWNSDSFIQTDR